jgi:hypothetical protein
MMVQLLSLVLIEICVNEIEEKLDLIECQYLIWQWQNEFAAELFQKREFCRNLQPLLPCADEAAWQLL